MIEVTSPASVAEFIGPGDDDNFTEYVTDLIETGQSQLDWCFVATEDGKRIGRVGFLVSPTTSDPAWLGSLPSHELSAFGLSLDWTADFLEPGQRLIKAAAASMRGEVPSELFAGVALDRDDHPDRLCRFWESLGLTLFQEKQGYRWVADGSTVAPGRLEFRTVDEVGRELYSELMGRGCADTLDRNDRYYWNGCGPDNWGRQMMEYLDPDDGSMWLVGYRNDEPVGYVAVARMEGWGSTIAHIGVVPEERGHGYVDDLLQAGTAAAREVGFRSMLSDVDVLNFPMAAAMRRNRHLDLATWHVWSYRGPFAI